MKKPMPARPLARPLQRRLDAAWRAYEAGEVEKAGRTVTLLLEQSQGHAEVRLLSAALQLDAGDPQAALADIDGCRGQVNDEINWRYFRASALFDLGEFSQAEAELHRVVDADPDWSEALYALAETLEFLGRQADAEEYYRRAADGDSHGYPPPTRLSREEFDGAVGEAVAALPADLSRRLRQVAVVVADLPSPEVLAAPDAGPPLPPTLLGLFVGPSLNDMSTFTLVTFPPTIFIYQRNLERVCHSRRQLVAEIGATLDHELGHFLGLSEADLAARGRQ